jgi:acylphosphatase
MARKSQSSQQVAVHLRITGRVQGVGFRWFTQKAAHALAITGWVRNQADGSVEAYGEAGRTVLEQWIDTLREGPSLSHVDEITTEWEEAQGEKNEFEIR